MRVLGGEAGFEEFYDGGEVQEVCRLKWRVFYQSEGLFNL
jgi:hypothetical protein